MYDSTISKITRSLRIKSSNRASSNLRSYSNMHGVLNGVLIPQRTWGFYTKQVTKLRFAGFLPKIAHQKIDLSFNTSNRLFHNGFKQFTGTCETVWISACCNAHYNNFYENMRVSIINGTIVVRLHLSQFGRRLDSLAGLNHTTSHKYLTNKWI